MPTLTQEQANAKFAIEQRRAEAEVAAIEAATARERAAVEAKTARDNDESQARIVAMAVGRTTTADPNTRKDTEESVGSLELNSPPPGFDPPPQEFIDSIQNVSYAVKTLLWYSLSTRIRQGYHTAISSYTLFCATRGVRAWPASELILAEWVAGRVFRADMVKQNRITANTIQSYLSAPRSYHVDHHLPVQAFSSLLIDRMLKGAHHIYPHSKKERLPITKEILIKIASVIPISIEEINIDAAFKVTWAGFFRLGEITYSNTEAQAPTFVDTKLTR